MARYTYDDFRKNAQNSGLLGEFSTADLQMAQKDPDFGMSILKYKQDYHNATTDEGRALANLNAENLRKSWGSYSGGQDGGSFAMDPMSPRHFQYADAPSYAGSAYDDDIAELWAAQRDYGDFTYDPYESRYDSTIQDLIAGILDRPDFSYDAATDPLYQQYRKQYTREGDRATEDALGAAAAASGGIPSSYASTAAGQAANYYAAQMTDKIPELYELAYNQYLNDYQMQLSDLGVVQGQEQTDYDRYLNDRNLDYNVWLNGYDRRANDLQTALGLQNNDFNEYLAALDQYNADRNFAYGQFTDELADQANERAQALENAILAGEYGDYSYLNDLGINTDQSPTALQQQANAQALAQAQVDQMLAAGSMPSAELLAASGYSQEYADALRNAYLLQASAGSGRSGGGGGSSGGGSNMSLTTAKQAASAGYFSDDVINTLRGNGYDDGMISAVYGWDPAASGQAMNESRFNAVGRSVAASLAQIRDQADVERLLGGLDGVWGQLSNAQRQQIQQLLSQYGYQYTE